MSKRAVTPEWDFYIFYDVNIQPIAKITGLLSSGYHQMKKKRGNSSQTGKPLSNM